MNVALNTGEKRKFVWHNSGKSQEEKGANDYYRELNFDTSQ